MPGKDFLPDGEGDFNIWQGNFAGKVTATPAAYGLTPADVVNLAAYSTSFSTSLSAKVVAKNAYRGASETNDDDRDALESEIRILAKRIQVWPGTTKAQREELGITVASTTRTPLSEQIVLTTPAPVIKAKCTESKTVRLDWYPDQAPGQSEALPHGIIGINLWVAEGGIPSDESQWKFLATDTNSPYIHNAANDSTVTMAYKAQWVDRRGRKGPFCLPVVVAVTA